MIFFGGYKSTHTQMKCWQTGAKEEARRLKLDGYSFEPIAYPEGALAGETSAVSVGAGLIADAVNEIVRGVRSSSSVRFVVVGHSSGAALANAVGEKVLQILKGPSQTALLSQIEFVDLDGFKPSSEIQNQLNTSCWSAETELEARSEKKVLRSPNADSDSQCRLHRAYQDRHCQTQWCLHFSLVNKLASANLGTDYDRNGYEGCATNLDWLLKTVE